MIQLILMFLPLLFMLLAIGMVKIAKQKIIAGEITKKQKMIINCIALVLFVLAAVISRMIKK